MVMFSQGLNSSRASSSVPDLRVMQSSPTSTWQLVMWTLRQDSGLMPSVLGEWGGLCIVSLSTVTFSQALGWNVQLGELVRVQPSRRTLRLRLKETRRGRGWCGCHCTSVEYT